jgi:hypothetical protein
VLTARLDWGAHGRGDAARPQAGDAAAHGTGITNPAAVMIDTQLRHVTRASIRGQLGADSSGWSFNEEETWPKTASRSPR